MQTCFNVSLPEVVVVLVGGRDSHTVQQVVGNLDKPLIIISSFQIRQAMNLLWTILY